MEFADLVRACLGAPTLIPSSVPGPSGLADVPESGDAATIP
jgi:hypothetical protein